MLRKTIIFLAIASALSACGKHDKDPAKPDAANAQADAKQKDGKAVQLLVAPEDVLTVQSSALANGPVITGSVQPERKADLRAGVSAIVLQVLKENGIEWELVRTWRGTRAFERTLKKRKYSPRLCPVCNPKVRPQCRKPRASYLVAA